jgi:hypothetical protein
MKAENRSFMNRPIVTMTASAIAVMALAGAAFKTLAADTLTCNKSGKACRFNMVRNAGLPAGCLLHAKGRVSILAGGPAEKIIVSVDGLRPNTDYDFFVIEVPKAPFGLAWYQGDVETDADGHGTQIFEGRFNQETFIVAQPGALPPAPQVHDIPPFPDAVFGQTQQVGPIHTFHMGLWFNSPADAASVGCSDKVTPFNGEHHAGVQVLNTSTFDDQQGPLFFIKR